LVVHKELGQFLKKNSVFGVYQSLQFKEFWSRSKSSVYASSFFVIPCLEEADGTWLIGITRL
jgi:hypothetical protein